MTHRKLTLQQRELLVGKLLGDGHLETRTHGRTYRLKVQHSMRQKAYVDWFYAAFAQWVTTPPRARMQRSGSSIYEKYEFQTVSSSSFRFFGQQFYGAEGKCIPPLIHKWLSPRALAVWYMDDGSIKSRYHRTILLNTHAYSSSDLGRLQKALQDRYGVMTTLRKQKDGTQIYVPSDAVDGFLSIIYPYVIESMRYKIPNTWLTHLPKK